MTYNRVSGTIFGNWRWSNIDLPALSWVITAQQATSQRCWTSSSGQLWKNDKHKQGYVSICHWLHYTGEFQAPHAVPRPLLDALMMFFNSTVYSSFISPLTSLHGASITVQQYARGGQYFIGRRSVSANGKQVLTSSHIQARHTSQ